MEDFLQILITFSIIIIAAVVNIRKRARNLEEGLDEEGIPEEWPTMTTTAPQPEPRTQHRKAVVPKVPRPLHPDSQELLTPEIPQRGGYHPLTDPKKEAATLTAHNDSAGKKGTTAPEGQKHPLTADFDAKKAVIWAEILKPKFEEE